ncbi:uncharacterized protein F4812DRAFT_446843 [Daldinia caldariorum]|uniref:uncharacterized protein n=1 Tax=Daldinia caldariorum TaxID=326644 RepID=UPI0020077760|nr:uncharacterized protein F4812DRAFT_446843 [Daldinia caldariorum]KAI1463410.1 hypothetical protein F4812DRAFT_446843 [Daldinia caldariorum]
MRLCKALRQHGANASARPSQFTTTIIAPRFGRRHFADDRAQRQQQQQQQQYGRGRQLASDREDVFKIRPETKTVETVAGDLPLSPVMDPTYWEAVNRHHVPKAKPGKPQNSVERQLRANPFAKALASNLRLCSITRTRVPRALLQDFTIVAHPETGAPWFIPRSLIPDDDPAEEGAEAEGIAESMDAAEREEAKLEEAEKDRDVESAPPEGPQQPAPATANATATAPSIDESRLRGPGIYCLARRELIAALGTKGTGFEAAPKRMAGASQRYKSVAGRVVWRKDMDSVILDMMREKIVDDLLYLSRLCANDKRYYIVKCYGWDDVRYKYNGAILWFGEPHEDAQSGRTRRGPGPFATFGVEKTDIQGTTYVTSVAVHNMPMLLGSERAERLREEARALSDGSIFMLAGRRTTDLQLKLWKLQGYLADSENLS